MKKKTLITLLAGLLTTLPVFGQGYFIFATGKSCVWDGFTVSGNVSVLSATVNTTFLWSAANTVPTVDVLTSLASSPTNRSSLLYDGLSVSQVWSAVLNGQFSLATNNSSGTLVSQLCGANGSVVYENASAFPVSGTTAGTAYTVYLVGWDAHYATPALAAANNAAVGWSSPFQYTPTTQIGNPNLMSSLVTSFGTFSVPEPGSLPLASVGVLALLSFRRWKK